MAIREVKIGEHTIGGDHPVLIQSMAATRTQDLEATLEQVLLLEKAGAGVVRVAVDNKKDVEALKWIRERSKVCLSVDLQENYLLAKDVAPFVEKFRYNPGHLHHLQPSKSIEEKVAWLVDVAKEHDCAIRVGVNCGSVAPDFIEKYEDKEEAIVQSALYHANLLDDLDFTRYCVSLKDSDPKTVLRVNRKFNQEKPEVPLHLGVTEAGMPPAGVIKSREAFEPLLKDGIGSTLRVSLTLPFAKKDEEIRVGHKIVEDVLAGNFWNQEYIQEGFNIISCPSCSRVENEKFIQLAEKVKEFTDSMPKDKPMTIAVMGCRVNGPGETDDADVGLWCGPRQVNMKRGGEEVGAFTYDEIIPKLEEEIDAFLAK